MASPHVSRISKLRAAIGLGALVPVFDIGKVVLIKVEVQRGRVVAERSVKQLGSDVKLGITLSFDLSLFVFPITWSIGVFSS